MAVLTVMNRSKLEKNTTNKKTLRVILTACALLISSAASTAYAERVMVFFKDKAQHQKNQNELFLSKQSSLMFSLSMVANAEIEQSLPALGAWVVNSDASLEQLQAALPNDVIIEKEIFHPAPKPVSGFVRTSAWQFNLRSQTWNWSEPEQLELFPQPTRPYGIDLVKAPEAWAASRMGEGVKVAVLDTGIDKDHPALRPNFALGKDFVNDRNSPYPYADNEGHGTHVAGTIAAIEMGKGFVGVAPRAQIYAGRVCSADGCSNHSIAMAIEWAISQGVDIISMSLGGRRVTEAERRAVRAAETAGIVVVAASGNDGEGRVSYPAALDTVIAVGAVNVRKEKADFSQWGPELDVVAPGVDVVSAVPMGSGRESQVEVFLNGTKQGAVPSLPFLGTPDFIRPVEGELVVSGFGKAGEFPAEVRGRMALISRGEIPFAEKINNAVAAGAVGVVLYNNQPGLVQGNVTVSVPVIMVEQYTGQAIISNIQAGSKVSVSISTLVSDYANFSGTSMATPHVSGVIALMRAARPGLLPAQVREILKQTSEPLGPNDQNQFGSGLVDAQKAVTAAYAQ